MRNTLNRSFYGSGKRVYRPTSRNASSASPRTKYLGFIISTKGIEVDPEKIQAINNWEEPHTVKGVQSFLGFCNFYRRFIQDYGTDRYAPYTSLQSQDVLFNFDRSVKKHLKS